MEPRRVNGKNHWYHETQSTICPVDVLPLVPEAAHVEDRFLLDLTLPEAWLHIHAGWLHPARQLAERLFPDQVAVSRLQTFTAYDRLSTALTVAQVYGVQRLCNHYAARLAPLPGPDSSRESNYRLAQITQYARQLAASPSVITPQSRQQLRDVGLSAPDIVLITQIVGFTAWQARVIAAGHALLGLPVRWIPGMPVQDDADAAPFNCRTCRWIADESLAEERPPGDTRHPPEVTAFLQPLVPLLAWDKPLMLTLSGLLARFDDERLTILAALVAARINGSVSCFNALASRQTEDASLMNAIRQGDPALRQWLHQHPDDSAIIQAAQLLTRAPDRFSAGQFTALTEQGLSVSQTFGLLAWCGLSGWLNRLRIGLGDTEAVA